MKKAGIDLPLREFQGTLDPLKCLRPSLVTPPPPAPRQLLSFSLSYKNPESSLNSVLLTVGIM